VRGKDLGAFFASQKTGLSAAIFFCRTAAKKGFPLLSLAHGRAAPGAAHSRKDKENPSSK
jgi:hypothetical protein